MSEAVECQINWSTVPVPYMADGLERYFLRGVRPGSFMTAILAGDLYHAVQTADMSNRSVIREWALWIMHNLPVDCYGSIEAVDEWCARGGFIGKSPV